MQCMPDAMHLGYIASVDTDIINHPFFCTVLCIIYISFNMLYVSELLIKI